MRYIILQNEKRSTHHAMLRVGIFKHDAFIQELHYWFDTKKLRQDTIAIGLEGIENLKKGLMEAE